MNLTGIIGVCFFIWLAFACWDQYKQQPAADSRPVHTAVRRQRTVAPAAAADTAQTKTHAAQAVPSDPAQLIVAVSREFDVPAGAVYGIWMKESSGMTSGWRDGGSWLLASSQLRSGSLCVRKYGRDRCEKLWASLNAVCHQRRRDGSRVCDPNEVRASYALALGPMQHLPTTLVVERGDGAHAWGGHVTDFDRDGVFDPFSLPDAMATAAKLVRRFYDEEGNWPRAINRYYGSQSAGYYEGTDDALGVMDHWKQWCSMPGHCRNTEASNRRYVTAN